MLCGYKHLKPAEASFPEQHSSAGVQDSITILTLIPFGVKDILEIQIISHPPYADMERKAQLFYESPPVPRPSAPIVFFIGSFPAAKRL
jgi:hypothetical protein